MGRTTTLLALLGPLALATLTGCADNSADVGADVVSSPSSSSAATPAAAATPSAASGETVVTVAEDDGNDARTAALTVGQVVRLDLATCGGCGYTWTVDGQPDSAVASRDATSTPAPAAASPASGAPLVGTPTTTQLAFRATGPGRTTVTVGYHPPAAGAKAERSVVVQLTVTGEPPAAPPAAAASKVVQDLYALQAKGTLVQSSTREQLAASFTPELADLLVQDQEEAAGEVGALDIDPLYAAQDAKVTGLAVAAAVVQGRTASVVASFTNLGKPTTVDLRLVPLPEGWRISDVRYADGRTLAGLLAG